MYFSFSLGHYSVFFSEYLASRYHGEFLREHQKTVFQIWRIKREHKSILVIILTGNIRAVQNDKNKFNFYFKYGSVRVVFDFSDFNCAHTCIQICWNCNTFYNMPDLKSWNIMNFEFEKSFSNFEMSDKQAAEKKHFEEPLSE